MKKASKVIALLLAVISLVSTMAICVSAYSYPMACTINYKDTNGKYIAPSVSFQVDAGSGYNPSYSSPTIAGYVLKKDTDAVVTYSMMEKYFPPSNYIRNGSASYTVIYEKACSMTVNFLYTNGRQARSPVTVYGKSGERYRVTPPNVSGYTPDKTVVSGRYASESEYTSVYYYPIYYTLSYNANGGTGAPASSNIVYGVGCGVSYDKPSRTGHTFMGWSTSSSATTADYQAGGFFYGGYADATLYAVWSPYEYTISFDANGGSGAPAAQTKVYGRVLKLPTKIPVRTGYDFEGWGASGSATAAIYQAGENFVRNRTMTLYAVWAIKTYTVSFHANGGSNAPASQTKTYGQPLTLTLSEPTRSGFAFEGWAKSSTGPVAYQPGDSYPLNNSTTLYAKWKVVPTVPETYTISYNANGGAGAPASQIKTQGIALTLSTIRPYRSGYTFMGWSTSSTGSGGLYYAGGTYYTDSSVTMYAVWDKDADIYTVSYDANGGTGAPGSQIKREGTALTLSSTTPTRDRYMFMGWSTSSSGAATVYYPGSSYTNDSSVTLYAMWTFIPENYTVTYSANGGTGAPAEQTKIENSTLTLSTVVPTKNGSSFMGWATSLDATTAVYQAGGAYTGNSDITLYAVWHNDSYDFSVSEITVTPGTVYQYDVATVKFRVDSWDRYYSYTDIPVEVLLNGKVIYSNSVDFAAYGVNYLTFTLNVGALEGSQTLTARINWDEHSIEKRTTNNSVTGTFTVEKKMEFSTTPITVNADYIAGNEVISSFYVSNDSASAVLPEAGLKYDFKVYYLDANNNPVTVTTQTWDNVVIPANSTNLVYFKWTIPENLVGNLLWCEGKVNGNSSIKEENADNNVASFNFYVKASETSQTPNTRYESTAPGDYAKTNPPTTSAGSATWNMWVYESGQFKLMSYGVRVTVNDPVVAPGSGCKTATYANGQWTMKSGYGISLSWKPVLESVGGYAMPSADSYTGAQNVFAAFPEFKYLTGEGKYRTLENVGGIYQFIQNTDADGNERIHFIPMYITDGSYTVSVTATQIWTPAGMITATRNSNTVNINGTVYDDFYQG